MAAKYTISFDTNAGQACVLTISDTTFGGAVTALKGSGRSPVVITHEGSEQDIFAPIMATSCEVTYLNEGSVSIEDFVTDDPARFTCQFTVAGVTKFYGVLSLDDLSERVIYQPNECRLTFTDGLGLLKNFSIADTDLSLLEGRYRLTDILDTLLEKTGLNLPLCTFANVYEAQMTNRTGSTTADPFYQAGINIKSFLENSSDEDKWEDCYSALEKILKAFSCRLFQEGGKWVVVRVPELASNPAGTQYNTSGAVVGALSNQFSTVTDLVPVNRSQVKFLKRAAKKLTATFNYRYPQLLKNANLRNVGNLRGTFTDGSNTVSRYDVADIALNDGQDAEIRVVRNTTTGREVERYLYMYFSSDLQAAAVFGPIEVDQGDNFNLTWKHRAATDSNFTGEFRFGTFLDGYGATNYSLQGVFLYALWQSSAESATSWTTTWGYPYRGSDDLTQYRTQGFDAENDTDYEMEFPADGQMYIGFYGWNNNLPRRADVDAIISDIRFEYVKYVFGGQLVKGQEHIISQTGSNREEKEEIYIDDSPATSIKGTLFYMDGGTTPNRTDSWSDDETNFYRFGELRAKRQMDIEGVTRYNLQGSFYGLCTLYNTHQFGFFAGRTFYPNRLTLDYGQNITEATFAEIDGPDSVGSTTYEFKPIYE